MAKYIRGRKILGYFESGNPYVSPWLKGQYWRYQWHREFGHPQSAIPNHINAGTFICTCGEDLRIASND